MTFGTTSETSRPRTADAQAGTPTPDDAHTSAAAPPVWLRFTALLPAAVVLSLGAVGLLLAIHSLYSAVVAYALGAVACIALVIVALPALRGEHRASREAHIVAVLGVTAILAITAWNGAHASQHVLINRDGGSYLNTGRWIARDGSLEVRPRVGPFAHDPSYTYTSFAVYDMPDGTLQFQFSHLLPVVLAEAYGVGGDSAMTHVPELLGGAALLAFFVLAWRLFRRPWFALAAMLTLAFVIPQVSFTRDSYSEIPSQLMLFTALWLLTTRKVLPHWRVAFVAGLFIGMMQAVRIDALVFVIGVPVLLAVAWLGTDRDDRRRTSRSSVAFALGLVPGLALGFTDLISHSGRYWSDLHADVEKLALVTVAVAIAMAVVVAVWRFVVPFVRRVRTPTVATGVAVFVALCGFALWGLRPMLQHVHGDGQPLVGYEIREHVTPDATRVFYERSLTWMSWYLGPVTIAAAIVGAAFLVRALVLGRFARTTAALAALVPATGLYLWKASAVSDHIWVMRRFLVGAFPLLVLLAIGLAAYVWPDPSAQSTGGLRTTRRVISVALVVAGVGWPVYTVAGLGSMTEQRGYLDVVKDACAHMGAKAAVVLLDADPKNNGDRWIAQTLRGWCGAKVAIVSTNVSTRASLVQLARDWRAQGTKLFAMADDWNALVRELPDAPRYQTRTAVNRNFLDRTVTHRPRALIRESFAALVAEVPQQ